jgi:[ribosomal protein S18]-alanine N-acetyltransferase
MMGFITRLFGGGEPSLSEASPRDAGRIAALHSASFRRGWSEGEFERLLMDRNITAHRVVIGTELAGFILSRRAADEAEILSVAVASSWRGRGLATRLLGLHLRRLAGLGVRVVFLEVDADNSAARSLYAGAHFREISRRDAYYRPPTGPSSTALVLRRELN